MHRWRGKGCAEGVIQRKALSTHVCITDTIMHTCTDDMHEVNT